MNLIPTSLVTSATACQQWLAQATSGTPAQTQVQLLKQLNQLHDSDLTGATVLEILELLRAAVSTVQDEASKRYIGKPLPLSFPEQSALDTSQSLWHALARNYVRLLDLALNPGAGLAPAVPRIAQRALATLADWQVDSARGQQLTDARYWGMAHQVFTVAESQGALGVPVDDTLRHGAAPTTPLAAYGELLLLHTIHMHEHAPKLQQWLVRWVRLWGGKLQRSSVQADSGALPLWTDISGDQPPRSQPAAGGGARSFETTELRKSVKGRITLLDQGETPAKLKLGDDCTQPSTGNLLRRAYQAWCKGGATGGARRSESPGECDLVAGLEAVHYYLSNREPFVPPMRDATVLRRDSESFAVLGELSKRKEANYSIDHGFAIQPWLEASDWSPLERAANLVCVSRSGGAGERIGYGTLVAIKQPRSPNFVLGVIDWVVRDLAGEKPRLVAGVRLVPGVAKPVAVTPLDVRDPYRQGLYLPAIAGLKPDESLIVPSGTFRVQRQVEFLLNKVANKVTLHGVLDRAGGFEHCTVRRTPV